MSQPRLKISSLVLERLNGIQDFSEGQVFGLKCDDGFAVLGFCVKSQKQPSGEEKGNADSIYDHDICPNLPGNINVLGAFIVCSSVELEHLKNKYFKNESKATPILLHIDLATHKVTAKLRKDKKYEDVEHEVPNESYWKKFIYLMLSGKVVITCMFEQQSLQDALSSFQNKVNNGVAFQLEGTEIFILEKDVNGPDITEKSDVESLISKTESNRMKNDSQSSNTLNFNMFVKNFCDSSGPDIAPVIKCERKNFKSAKITLSLDTLSMVNLKTKVNKLYEILLESLRRNLTLNENCLAEQFKNSDADKISLPQIYHFFPLKCGHFVTIAYPKKQMEDQLVSTREIYHKVLSLPNDLPVFRRGNVHVFSSEGDKSSFVLINPHEGLKPSGVVDGEVSLVQGRYGYHHYMQEGFDDNGWGCAYRSLQTIFSWFRHQGFTGKPIPTHKEIQQCLVDIGDKPSSFVGSRNWIGSTEVSFVLDTMLSVSSRIVSVSSGEELSMKGGELSHHFKTQGTPIMIGGGVLAHTILGVDYNRKTGSLKFLILDPHYTGAEDLPTIQSKGWCGWKGMDFWKKNAFYNMCLPLRPKSI